MINFGVFELKNFLVIFLVLFFLNSCAGVVLTGATAAGVAVAREKSVGNTIDDNTIWSRVKSALYQEDVNNLFPNVGVTVEEGRVLLTGNVETPEHRAKAVQIVWMQPGVEEVINEIKIKDLHKKYPYLDAARDTLITAQVKGRFLADRNVRSINYSVDTVNNVVFIMGIAQNQNEIDVVNYLAGTIKNVKKVVNYAKVKKGY